MRCIALRLGLGTLAIAALTLGCGGGDAAVGTAGASGTQGSTGETAGSSGSSGTADTSGAVSASGSSGSGSADSTTAADASSDESTGGEPCRVDEDCDDRAVCTDDYCGAAGCTHDPINGQPAPTGQVDGDCLVLLCVDGEPSPTNSDNDLPVDMNVCTDDVCQMGVPSNPDSPAGTPCNDQGLCDGMGTCSECISPDDCDQLPPDDDCQTRTCIANTCGQTFTDADVEVDPQAPGDCQVLVCDGQGATVAQADDSDLPDDGLECTTDVCDAGNPENVDVAPGEPCSVGVCDGMGGCVGCVDAGDCPGMDTFCQTPTCDNATCGIDNEPVGTALPGADQDAGNCLELQCDALGNALDVADDADVPVDDGNECTGEVCSGGNPDHPDLPIDSPCGVNDQSVCDGAGTCVECNDDTQCPTAPQCFVAVCVANACENQVTAGVACEDGSFCTAGDTCNAGGACVGGASPCAGVDGDSNCSETCDELANDCLGDDPAGASCSDGLFCTTGDICNGSGTCNGGGNPCSANVGDADSDCTESCNEGTDTCTANDPNASACSDGLFCTVTDTCNNGVCGGAGNPCTVNVGDLDSDCSESCNEGTNNCTSNDLNGSTCSDGLFCTLDDACNNAGVCVGSGTPCVLNPSNSDCSESCNEGTNNCTSNDPVNSLCSDGLFCTGNDRCNAVGTCVGGSNPCTGVDDGDLDCTEACSENSNNCTSDDPDFTVCGQSCFVPGLCTAGLCIGGIGC